MRLLLVAMLFLGISAPVLGQQKNSNKNATRPAPPPKGVQLNKLPLQRRQQLEKLLKESASIALEVSKMRGLAIKSPIKKKIVSKAQVKAYIRARLKAEYTSTELKIAGDLLRHFQLIPRNVDYETYFLEYVTSQLGGFYDPIQGTLYIADWIPIIAQRPVMAHEILHAIQDQHFGLKRFITRVRGNSDRSLAQMALVEGEGMGLMYMYSLKSTGVSKTLGQIVPMINGQVSMIRTMMKQVFPSATSYMIDMQLFSYIAGARFVGYLHDKLGWAGLNKVYKRLPNTTEQVMHPEKYLKNEQPVTVRISRPKSWPKRWKVVYRDSLGEFGMLAMLRSKLPESIARQACAGWNGAQIAVLSDGSKGPISVLLHSAWDTPKDAKEFISAYQQFIRSRYPGALQKGLGYTLPGGRRVVIRKKGLRVDIAENLLPGLSL